MRTHEIGNLIIEYPDEIAFCFNHIIVNLHGNGVSTLGITEVRMEISSDGDTTYTESRAPFKQNVFFDAASYVQASFDYVNEHRVDYQQAGATNSRLGMSFSFLVQLYNGEILKEAFSFETFVLWGAMRVGERYNGDRTLTWFKNYPFSVGLYSASSGTVQVTADDGIPTEIALSGQGVWNLMLKGIQAHDRVTFHLPGSETAASIFDNTFDYTFQGLFNTATTITCKVNDCDKGVYVRWINRHGMYCYWLFQAGDESRQVENDGEFIRNNMQDYSYTNGYHGGTGRKQRKTEDDTLQICAPLVDSSTYDFLFELTTSPVVDLYAGKDANGVDRWKGINVSVEKFIKTKSSLQDFVCTLILPELNLQSL